MEIATMNISRSTNSNCNRYRKKSRLSHGLTSGNIFVPYQNNWLSFSSSIALRKADPHHARLCKKLG